MGMELHLGTEAVRTCKGMASKAARQTGETLAQAGALVEDTIRVGKQAMAGLKGTVPGQAVVVPHAIRSFRNPAVRPSGKLAGKLYGHLKAGLRQELQSLGKLTLVQQAQFREIAALLVRRPDGRAALRDLLLDGRLTRPSRFADNGDLLEQLHQIIRQKLAPRLDRQAYLAEVLQELRDFAAVNKGPKGTCAATTARGMLIQFDGAEYLRFQRGLISPRGVAPLREANGSLSRDPRRLLRRKPDWYFDDVALEPGRTIAARVQDPAAMQYAYDVHGPRYRYDNARDTQVLRSNVGKALGSGLQNIEIRYLLMGYFPGSRWAIAELPAHHSSKAAAELLTEVGRLASRQRPIPVAVDYPSTGPHEIGVVEVTAERVRFYNALGKLESLARKDFEAILLDALLPKRGY